jgi:hypothetical protein
LGVRSVLIRRRYISFGKEKQINTGVQCCPGEEESAGAGRPTADGPMGLNLALISILPWLYRVLKILFFTGGGKK